MSEKIITLFVLLATFWQIEAQVDTTIYDIVEESPRFPMCEVLDTTIAAKQECSQQALLAVIYQNVQYPMQARMEGLEGMVVASFVVEADSTLSNANILRDIGGGCGDEVLAVLNAFNNSGIRWIPGKEGGVDVRSKMTIPIKFRLKEAPPYVIMDGDTVYTTLDKIAEFEGGDVALSEYIDNTLQYPTAYQDSCFIGYMDVQLLIQPDGIVKNMNISDYSDLGLDFQLEVLTLISSMFQKWTPANYKNRGVPSTVDIRLSFVPSGEGCQQVIEDFQAANIIAAEGMQLINEEQQEMGLEKLNEAIEMQPNNAEFLSFRGQTYVDAERYKEACKDLFEVRRILGTTAYDQLLMIVCRMEESSEGEEEKQ